MFLRWIPQILSYVDFSQESFLESLLLRIATSYPMALYYPAKLTLESHRKRTTDNYGVLGSKLMRMLDIPKLDRFVAELCQIVIPCMKVSTMVSDVSVKLSGNSHVTTAEQYRKLIIDSMQGVFPDASDDLGREHQKVIPFKAEWLKLLEYDFQHQKNDIWQRLNYIKNEMVKLVPKHNTLQLNKYSPWLARYHFDEREEMLELPGQYNVDHKPNVVNHVKIVKISNQLEMYDSLRKPLRLQIIASDGKVYDFLVKYGEDLRQDQRIQQLLKTISNRLALDLHCKNHQLSVRTYEVVPIRMDFGIIGWIPNTSSIRNVAVRSMTRFNPDGNVTNTIKQQFEQFLMQTAGVAEGQRLIWSMIYGKVAAVSTPEKVSMT